VILSYLSTRLVPAALAKDAETPGEGWTCFGGDGVNVNQMLSIDLAPWLGSWAPGNSEGLLPPGVGYPLAAGSRLIVQVHYSLLAAAAGADTRDQSRVRLRLAPIYEPSIKPLRTMLLSAPIELPCASGVQGRLCDRKNSVFDVVDRFGLDIGLVVTGLTVVCNPDQKAHPGPTQSCTRRVRQSGLIRSTTAHMHKLGRAMKIELNPGTPQAVVLLDNTRFNFDNQDAVWLKQPVRIKPGDRLKVTCTHDAGLRTLLPDLRKLAPRYVVWGEGTGDEMCLGVLNLTS
jgi:Copper type II ascorbate-dependent monooxygenase, C-terminal domain